MCTHVTLNLPYEEAEQVREALQDRKDNLNDDLGEIGLSDQEFEDRTLAKTLTSRVLTRITLLLGDFGKVDGT